MIAISTRVVCGIPTCGCSQETVKIGGNHLVLDKSRLAQGCTRYPVPGTRSPGTLVPTVLGYRYPGMNSNTRVPGTREVGTYPGTIVSFVFARAPSPILRGSRLRCR
eukprot:139618-Rhodomonas_salina.1